VVSVFAGDTAGARRLLIRFMTALTASSIGKKGLAQFGAVYSEFTGGASALAVSKIIRVKHRLLEELGPTELVWIWEVKDFGPLLVTQDHQGDDLKKIVTNAALSKVDTIVKAYA
jgi:L(+)-tartrate dehydratase beta subunit